jgi:hypothetical protein
MTTRYPARLPGAPALLVALLLMAPARQADAQAPAPPSDPVPLSDQPLLTPDVPGNLALALSVEFPTAVSVAHIAAYSTASTYLGYFDPNKCYLYSHNATETLRHFYPAGTAAGRVCTGANDSM